MPQRHVHTEQNQDVVTTTILINGSAISQTYQVNSITIDKEANRISSARVELKDGDAAGADFPASNSDLFVPGNEIEIQAGYHSDNKTLFKGIIIKHGIKLRANGNSILTLDCKDKAVKLTIGRYNKYYYEVSDSDVMEEILGRYELETDVSPTEFTYQEMVQYDITDWDFLMTRLEMNGLLCFNDDGKITIAPPDLSSEAVSELVYGATIIDLDAEMDARHQLNTVKSFGWDQANQETQEIEGVDPGISLNGNLSTNDLAEVINLEAMQLFHGGLLKEAELQAWADARLLRAQLAKIRGVVKSQGLDTIKPGVLINLQGIGERFNGNVFVTGIRHAISEGDWKTHTQFGLDPEWFTQKHHTESISAAGIIPGIQGLHIGIVTQLSEDPEGEERIQVRLPIMDMNEQGVWARVSSPDAGDQRTMFFRPEIGDEVVVGFLNNDPRNPIVLGGLHSSAKPSPLETNDDNHEKGIVTRSDMRLIFNDDKVSLQVETPAGKKIILDEDAGELLLADENDNKILMNSDGILMESASDIQIKASGDLILEGVNINGKATAEFKGEGSAGAEISSGGSTAIKGAIVQIN